MEYDFSWSEKLAIYAYMEYMPPLKKLVLFLFGLMFLNNLRINPVFQCYSIAFGRCRSDLVINYNQLYPNQSAADWILI